MAGRLLCIAIARNTLLTSMRCPMRNRLVSPKFGLHTKIFDKETSWDAQRMANRQNVKDPITESLEKNPFKEEKPEILSSFAEFRTTAIEENDNFKANTDADTFGGKHDEISNEIEDEGDLEEENYLNNPPKKSQRLPQIQYIRMIKEQLKAKQLQGAIDILEKRMKQDRVKPETFTYNLLISGCAKAGYTRKAFQLFNKMRQRGLRVTGGTYTSLFNACANAPSAADGINRANHVREIMLEKGVEPNVMNYNVMIKAYGRWGDVKTAYQLVDEMKEKKLKPTAETFNFLLQACASDTKYGFRHCLLTWHKMLQSGFKPDYYSFNTVLRCVRDCNFGDLQTMQEVLNQIIGEHQAIQITSTDQKLLVSQNETAISETQSKSLTRNPFSDSDKKITPTKEIATQDLNSPTTDLTEEQYSNESTSLKVAPQSLDASFEVPNLLAPQPHLGSMLALSEITQPHERFLLLGGLTGFLDLMKQNGITPNIQMFTMILEVIPPTKSAEKQVLSFIRRIGLKADVDFFNVLIKKRSMRFDYEGAKEVLSMINTAGLRPDIVTYGVLALGCQTQEEARELLQEMRNKEIRMNIQILGAMLRQGCAQRSFPYVCEIMQISLDEHVKPNGMFLRHLNDFYTQCARSIDARHPSTKTKNYKKQHARFCEKLRLYQEEHGIAGLKLADAIRVITEGPYKQYKEAKVEGLEPEKNESLIQKQKIRKYIKKIKIAALKGDDDDIKEYENDHNQPLPKESLKSLAS